jgi:phosphatidate cytidylyltransferase
MGALRRLTPDEQVSLLFLILFGALLLVSAVTALWSLREKSDETSETWRRYLRDLRAVWIGTTLFWLA